MLGLPARLRPLPRLPHRALREPEQHVILGHRHHIRDPWLRLEERQHLRPANPPSTDPNAGPGERLPHPRQEAPQIPIAPAFAGALPGRSTAVTRYCSARC